MRITKYYCDTCSKEVSSEDDLTMVTIAVRFREDSHCSGDVTSYTNNICSDCLKEVGLLKETLPEFAGNKPNISSSIKSSLWNGKSFKDIIKNILRKKED